MARRLWCGLNEVRNLVANVLGGLRDAGLDALDAALELTGAEVAGGALDGRLEVARVALHETVDLHATLAQAALQLRAGPLELTLELVAGGRAPTLVALDVLRHLTRAGGPLHVRLDRLDDVVASHEGRADRDQHCALSLGGDGLDEGLLRLGDVLHRVGGVSSPSSRRWSPCGEPSCGSRGRCPWPSGPDGWRRHAWPTRCAARGSACAERSSGCGSWLKGWGLRGGGVRGSGV